MDTEYIISQSIWKATPIEETPIIELIGWSIFQVKSDLWEEQSLHFSGYNITEMEGRASSAIIEFNEEKMIGKTESGRTYKLLKEFPRLSQVMDVDYVWNWWKQRNKITECVKVRSYNDFN